jgi:hypothetical protein
VDIHLKPHVVYRSKRSSLLSCPVELFGFRTYFSGAASGVRGKSSSRRAELGRPKFPVGVGVRCALAWHPDHHRIRKVALDSARRRCPDLVFVSQVSDLSIRKVRPDRTAARQASCPTEGGGVQTYLAVWCVVCCPVPLEKSSLHVKRRNCAS